MRHTGLYLAQAQMHAAAQMASGNCSWHRKTTFSRTSNYRKGIFCLFVSSTNFCVIYYTNEDEFITGGIAKSEALLKLSFVSCSL
jgi:hypothetical protein